MESNCSCILELRSTISVLVHFLVHNKFQSVASCLVDSTLCRPLFVIGNLVVLVSSWPGNLCAGYSVLQRFYGGEQVLWNSICHFL